MRKYKNIKELKNKGIELHNVIVTYTSPNDYEMDRKFLLKEVDDLSYDEFLYVEGWHCSCFDFEDTEWEGIVYTREELSKLANVYYNEDDLFWQSIKETFCF